MTGGRGSGPASLVWIQVGATRFTQEAGSPEMASVQFGSGGGFSGRFTNGNASWQQAAVAAYLAQGSSLPKFPPESDFASNGRAVRATQVLYSSPSSHPPLTSSSRVVPTF